MAINKQILQNTYIIMGKTRGALSNYRLARKQHNTDDTRNAKLITKVIRTFSNSVFFSFFFPFENFFSVYKDFDCLCFESKAHHLFVCSELDFEKRLYRLLGTMI